MGVEGIRGVWYGRLDDEVVTVGQRNSGVRSCKRILF